MATEFGGEVNDVSFTKRTIGDYDPLDPSGAPTTTEETYTAKGLSFGYGIEFIDGEKVQQGDYKVMILLGTIDGGGDDAAQAQLDLGLETTNLGTVIQALEPGEAGNLITVELVGDAPTGAGTLTDTGTHVRIGYLPDTSTVDDLEALIATSSLIGVKTAGAPGTLDASDAFASVPLEDGADETTALDSEAIPQPGDTVTAPPPNQTTPKVGVIVGSPTFSQAFVTVQVRGPSA